MTRLRGQIHIYMALKVTYGFKGEFRKARGIG
jgi:hypothetical protein